MIREELISMIALDIENHGNSFVPQQEVWPALTCREGLAESELFGMLRELIASYGWEFQVVPDQPQLAHQSYLSFYPKGNPPEWPDRMRS